ncbi:MAG: hypothetical protein ACYDHT_03615 [Solirubrobacteraceae bacterium]
MRRAALALLATLAIGGCGSGSTSTHDKFVSRANAICASGRERAKHVSDARIKRKLPIHGPEVVAKEGVLLDQVARELAAVKAPSAERPVYDRFLSSARRAAVLVKQLAVYYRRHDQAGIERVGREIEANKTSKAARQAGLAKCA